MSMHNTTQVFLLFIKMTVIQLNTEPILNLTIFNSNKECPKVDISNIFLARANVEHLFYITFTSLSFIFHYPRIITENSLEIKRSLAMFWVCFIFLS